MRPSLHSFLNNLSPKSQKKGPLTLVETDSDTFESEDGNGLVELEEELRKLDLEDKLMNGNKVD